MGVGGDFAEIYYGKANLLSATGMSLYYYLIAQVAYYYNKCLLFGHDRATSTGGFVSKTFSWTWETIFLRRVKGFRLSRTNRSLWHDKCSSVNN